MSSQAFKFYLNKLFRVSQKPDLIGRMLMSWIKTISYKQSVGRLRILYDRIKGPGDNVDNIMMLHSLRPHSMEGHMSIYKNVLHHSSNTLPKWFLETLGVWVSYLNGCNYCVEHHFSGLKRLLHNDVKAIAIRDAIELQDISKTPLSDGEKIALTYAELLKVSPATMSEDNVTQLQMAGYSDGEVLEMNQVISYFNYANRTVLGLGCSLKDDIIGLSPNNSNDPDDWAHK